MSTASRVHFFERQFLRAQDLADEQGYHLATRRRHNISHHTWGIVEGLSITNEGGALLVQPGVAVDGYGRELVLETQAPLDPEKFDYLDTITLDVWLLYQRKPGAAAPSGYVSSCVSADNTFYRWLEAPLPEMRRREGGGMLDPLRPPGVSSDALSFALRASPPDDPRQVWPVYLGTITRDRSQPPEKEFMIDMAQRVYVGAVAARLDHPQVAARVDIGVQETRPAQRSVNGNPVVFEANPDRRFAVFIPEDGAALKAHNKDGEVRPRIEITQDGNTRVVGSVAVNGDVNLAGGALEFTAGQQVAAKCDPQAPSIYRASNADGDQLRIDLGSRERLLRQLVIGFSMPDGKFKECLKVEVVDPTGGDYAARVTVFGDLIVNGLLDAERPRVVLSEDAARAIQASFMTGVAAAMS